MSPNIKNIPELRLALSAFAERFPQFAASASALAVLAEALHADASKLPSYLPVEGEAYIASKLDRLVEEMLGELPGE